MLLGVFTKKMRKCRGGGGNGDGGDRWQVMW